MKEEKFLDAMEHLDDEIVMEAYAPEAGAPAGRKVVFFKKRRLTALVAAAVLILATFVTANAFEENEWAIDILNYLGLSSADTMQLHDGSVQIGFSDKQQVKSCLTGDTEQVTVTADYSVGDRRNSIVKFVTDVKVPEDYDENNDYFAFDDWTCEIRDPDSGEQKSSAGCLESRVEEGKLVFYMITQDCEDLNKSRMDVTFGGLSLYHDLNNPGAPEEKQRLYDGSWNLGWTYNYKSNERSSSVNKLVDAGDESIMLKKIVVTPLQVKVMGYTRYDLKDYNTALRIEKLICRNGSEIAVSDDGGSSFGTSAIPGINYIEEYVMATGLGQAFNPDQVKAVVINGKEYEM